MLNVLHSGLTGVHTLFFIKKRAEHRIQFEFVSNLRQLGSIDESTH